MRSSTARRIIALGSLLALWPAVGHAQEAAERSWVQQFSVAGELLASIAPRDDGSFFNYTDYSQDLLRLARLRLLAAWRVSESVQVETELRLQTSRDVDLAAWYVRWQPKRAWPLHIQAGRIPPVVGAFMRRAYGRDNAVLGTPLAYQYLTSLRRDAAPADVDDLLRMRGRGWQPFYPIGSTAPGPGIPLATATSWDTGVQVFWQSRGAELAGAITRGAPSVPVVHDTTPGLQWSGRAGVQTPAGIIIGISGARGHWLDRDVVAEAGGALPSAGRQTLVGVDAEYGRGAWLVRSEWVRTVHVVPLAELAGSGLSLPAHSGFAEVRWRPHPRWQIAGRAGYLRFGRVEGASRPTGPWDAAVDRLEGTVGYRVNRHIDVRAGWQHNWRDGGRVRRRGFPVASVLVWF